MNMEAENRKRNPESRDLSEAEPSLPTDPTEAAAWLEEIWKGSGGWQSQHPLRMKVSEPEDYQALSDDEKQLFEKLGNQFKWLAEMHRSEMLWQQSYTRTNYGEVTGFRFGYSKPESPEENVPQAYIFKPYDEGESAVFISKGNDGWKVEPLEEVAANYAKRFDY